MRSKWLPVVLLALVIFALTSNMLVLFLPSSRLAWNLYKFSPVPIPRVFVIPTLVRESSIEVTTSTGVYKFRMLRTPGPYIYRRAVNMIQQQPGELSSDQAQRVLDRYYCNRQIGGNPLRSLQLLIHYENHVWKSKRYECTTL